MASTTRTEDKDGLRRRLRAIERELSAGERAQSDRLLLERFSALPQVERSPMLLLFWGMGFEPDTQKLFGPLLERGKTIALPRCLPEGRLEFRQFSGLQRLEQHAYGMWEPDLSCPVISPGEDALALIPAVCYDTACVRLGRGGGYYDRFLTAFSGFTVGLCREKLLQERCPREPHDQSVELVLTENCAFRRHSTR